MSTALPGTTSSTGTAPTGTGTRLALCRPAWRRRLARLLRFSMRILFPQPLSGGWQHDTLTEDSDLSYRAQVKGWKFVYMPTVECPSELPVETYAFQVQQSRWAKGLTQCALKLWPRIWKAPLPWRTKAEAWCH